jgi:hypothetical protein
MLQDDLSRMELASVGSGRMREGRMAVSLWEVSSPWAGSGCSSAPRCHCAQEEDSDTLRRLLGEFQQQLREQEECCLQLRQ